MAVEIPVYIDIQGAIDKAIKEIPSGVKDIQKVVNKNTLKLDFAVSGGKKMNLQELLLGKDTSMEDLKAGLASIRKEFDRMSKAAAANSKADPGLKKTKALAKAYALVEQRVTGVSSKSSAAAMMVEHNINKTVAQINKLKASLSGVTTGSEAWNRINYQIKTQEKRLEGLSKQAMRYKMESVGLTKEFNKQSNILSNLGVKMGAYLSVYSLLRFVKQIRDVTGELEYQRIALGKLIQDEEYGDRLFGRIIEAAKQSPFRITHLVEYTKQLAAYRVEQEKLYDTTMRLADISAGLGVDMNRLILAYGQVRAASVLRGQELRQFTEAGIPLVELLAEKFTELNGKLVTTGEVFQKISERAVPFSMISDIFEDLTDKGGMFYKMQEEQAKTLRGRWEKLKDAYDQALMRLGESDTFQNLNDVVLAILNKMANNLQGLVRVLNAGASAWIAYWIAQKSGLSAGVRLITMVARTDGALKVLQYGIAGATVAWKRFVKALSANWVGLVLSAIAGLVTYFTMFKRKADEAALSLDGLYQATDKMQEANTKHDRLDKIIERYEKLASKAEKTTKETEKLEKTLKRIKEEFPDFTGKIDDSTDAVEENVKWLREQNELLLENERNRQRSTLTTNENILEEKKNELNRLNDEVQVAQDEYNRALNRRNALQDATGANGGFLNYLSNSKKTLDLAEQSVTKYYNALQEVQGKHATVANDVEKLENAIKRLRAQLDGTEEEDFTKNWEQWKKEAYTLHQEMVKEGETPVFTPEDFKSINSVYNLFGKLKSRWKDVTESLKGMNEQLSKMDKSADGYAKLSEEIENTEKVASVIEALRSMFGFDFSEKKTYERDPFIDMMNERIRFMKDFKSAYDDMTKYVGKDMALDKTLGNMKERGISLKLDPSEQRMAAEELSEWYQGAIDRAFEEAKKHGAKGASVTEFLSQQITGSSNQAKLLRDFQKMIQSIWDAKTDFDTEQMAKNFDRALAKLKDEIKHSEEARNFFNDILDMTGDADVARDLTISVYGDVGSDFKERMQKQLNEAFMSLDWTSDDMADWGSELGQAIDAQDFKTILKYISHFPKEWQSAIKQMASDSENFQGNWLKSIVKTYEKTKTYAERITDIQNREQQKRKEISESDILTPEQKDTYIQASIKKEAKDISEVNVEALKNTYEWTKAFEDLDRIGSITLVNLRQKIEELIEAEKDSLSPESLKTLTDALEKIKTTQATREPLSAIASGAGRAAMIAPALLSKAGTKQYDKAIEKIKKFNETAKETDKIDIDNLQDAFMEANKTIEDGVNGASAYMNMWKNVLETLSDAFALDEVPILGDTINAVVDGLGLVAAILPVIIALTTALSAAVNSIPFVAILTAIVTALSAIIGLIKGIINAKVENLNKKIEEQKKLIDQLEYSYERLDKMMEKALGSDYIDIYNKKLENLAAKQAAYLEQASLEREKGKKADEEKIKDYEDSAREAADDILDMQGELAEFFTGMDVTSAAKDFAQAWIDAYKEFGSTTDAMKEKFNEMVQNMVINSLAARLIQGVLKPIFEQIDDAAKDGSLTAQEIGSISAMIPAAMSQIENGMTGMVNQLTAAGVNLRQQAGTFTGISRDIASASEESITGLAAGINTQNFYMQHIDQNVAMILSAITGGTTTAQGSVTGQVSDPYKDQMLIYAAYIPDMGNDLRNIYNLLNDVIKPRGMVTTKVVHTNL